MAVAEELHFGRAATRLYIAQPSLSHQIRKLEEALGTALFVRSSRRVQLTAAGRALAREAPTALAALEQAVQLTRLAGAGIATTIRLGYTPVTGFDTLTTLLDAVREDHPEFMVDAREFFSAEIPERLRAGDLDIGLALASFAEHTAKAGAGIIVRDVVDPPILAQLSVLWPTDDPAPAVTSVLATARRCAERNKWLRTPLT